MHIATCRVASSIPYNDAPFNGIGERGDGIENLGVDPNGMAVLAL